MKRRVFFLSSFLLAACAPTPLSPTSVPPTLTPMVAVATQMLLPTTTPLTTISPTESGSSSEAGFETMDRPLEINQASSKYVSDVVLPSGVVIPSAALLVDSTAQKIEGFPMTDAAVGNLALRAAAETHWYHGPVQHDPRTEQMPDSYIDEFASLLIGVQSGESASQIQSKVFAYDVNGPGVNMQEFDIAFFPGNGDVSPNVVAINNLEIVYLKVSSITNPDASANEQVTISQEFPRLDKVHEAGMAYELEIDNNGTLRIKIGLAFNFGVGQPEKDLAGHTESALDWLARNQGVDQRSLAVSQGESLLSEGFQADIRE